ncbi:hypothetical protein SAMN05428954_1327 [Streptomyces sp. 2112.3]|nr:hypothetical protein BX261_5956 [Streptomyces sp. 2321.6]SDR02241.1 hypothetical protein SAMN05216511_1304 [Streptomyces sp. KS_16]SED91148.1 hypothetical protein SAMN05428954_1327 [Streptomyces sp. 2112.3]SNC72801.1 hypothetical protein SAMN06272741_5884 [Streptomyces sp. 2114.4]
MLRRGFLRSGMGLVCVLFDAVLLYSGSLLSAE